MAGVVGDPVSVGTGRCLAGGPLRPGRGVLPGGSERRGLPDAITSARRGEAGEQ